jgi:AcrR family transcriptional regulator
MTSSGVRGEYAKTAQRRREIIAAAVQVFSESGYRDGSLRDVADRAGITHAGIRHHFPTKVDLLEAVLDWRDRDALARAGQGSPRGRAVLHAWVGAVVQNTATPALVDLEITLGAEATSSDHPAHEYFTQHYESGEKILRRAYEAIEADGELADGFTPQAAARMVLAMTIGVQALWLRNRDIDPGQGLRTCIQATLAAAPHTAR